MNFWESFALKHHTFFSRRFADRSGVEFFRCTCSCIFFDVNYEEGDEVWRCESCGEQLNLK